MWEESQLLAPYGSSVEKVGEAKVLCVRVRLRGRCWGAFCFSPSVWSLGPRGHVFCA